MKEFVITTDSTCDLPDNYIREHNIGVLILHYMLDGVLYGSDITLDSKEFYAKMKSGSMPTTNACTPEDAKTCFLNHIKKGEDIIHIAFSSALSGSYNNAHIAAQELSEEYPDSKITVIDSLCASLGEGLLVHKALQLKEGGKSYEETVNWIENNKLHLCHQFTVDDLHHLHRGGRVSKTTAIIGTMINVKPVLHVDNEGRLIPVCNVRGRKKSLNTLVEHMEQQISGYESQNDTVFISHGDSYDDAMYVADLIKKRFGIEDILINYVSPTIGAHSGPGTIALFYLGSER